MRPRFAALLALLASLALAACQLEETASEQSAVSGPSVGASSPLILEEECKAAGGSMVVGLAGPQCARPQPDAGKSCSDNADCAGFCLAKTRTCSPVTPFFGCHEVLQQGQVAALCVD